MVSEQLNHTETKNCFHSERTAHTLYFLHYITPSAVLYLMGRRL